MALGQAQPSLLIMSFRAGRSPARKSHDAGVRRNQRAQVTLASPRRLRRSPSPAASEDFLGPKGLP